MPVTKSILKFEILIYSFLIIVSILVSVFVIKNFVGNIYHLKWKDLPQRDEDSVSILEEKAIKLIPSKSSSFYELGRYYHKKAYAAVSSEEHVRLIKLAQEFLVKAIFLQPSNSYYLAEYARVAGGLGDIDRAMKYFEISTSLSKTDPSIHKLYARWSLYRAKSVFRIEDLDFLMMMYSNPEEVIPFYNERLIGGVMAKTFIRIAEREWDEALRLGISKSRTVFRDLGDLCVITGKLNKAIDSYKNAGERIKLINSYFIKQDYKNLFIAVKYIINNKTRVFWSKWNDIKKLLDKIIIVNQKDYEAYYWLGRGYYQHRMFEEAIENLKKATTLKPDLVDGHLFLAKSYETVRRTDMSIHEYTEVLKIKPDHKEANLRLGEVLKDKL